MRVQWQEVDNERSMTRCQQQEPRGQQQAVNNERSMARVWWWGWWWEVNNERSMTRGPWQEAGPWQGWQQDDKTF